ncbi:MAG: Spy/CpxP family protein refolding chaperone [Prevotellaceae bacterium]|jgi:Spy/CpxP family protein refolding chaperone|nr:Spy/CpxP family protein refolding chaperone [Prevotellaceae bacterium]
MKKIALLFLAFAVVTLTAQAQHGPGKGHKENLKDGKKATTYVYRMGGDNHCSIPNLSDGQKEEVKKLRLEMTKETTSIRNQIAEKRARLNTLQSEDKADMSAINKTIDEIAALQAKQMKAKANFHVKVRALLDDEQKIAFDSRKHHRFNFNFGDGMGKMKMRSFRFGDADFGDIKERLKGMEGLEALNNIDFDSIFEKHFEFEMED